MTGAAVEQWWCGPQLIEMWAVIGARLERNGVRVEGVVILNPSTREQRHALADLLGRPVTQTRVRVDLARLEERLTLRAGLSLRDAVEQVTGQPLVSRPAAREEARVRREAPYDVARHWISAHSHRDAPWVHQWLTALRRDGLLSRAAAGDELLRSALLVLDEVALSPGDHVPDDLTADPCRGEPRDGPSEKGLDQRPPSGAVVARTQLAAALLGDAHALDADRPLSTVVLRALAARVGVAHPVGALDRRVLWESVGVVTDTVSSTALTWRVIDADGPSAAPRHVTWWDLRRRTALDSGRRLLVCENPRVLEAVAEKAAEGDLRGQSLADLSVVCTSGRPNLVTGAVLDIVRPAADMAWYHGDLDWPGVALTNAAIDRWGLEPLLMEADDYLAASASLSLTGVPVTPSWSPELGAAMRQRGLAVHEEAVLESVLLALADPPSRTAREAGSQDPPGSG